MKLSEASADPLPGLSGFGTWMLWELSEREGGQTGGIPLGWSTIKEYDAMIAQGYVEEVIQRNKMVRKFRITPAGRRALQEDDR